MSVTYQPPKKIPNQFVVNLHYFRKFNWRERFKIFFGFNAVIDCAVKVDKRDQRVWDHCALQLTEALSAADDEKRQINSAIAKIS